MLPFFQPGHALLSTPIGATSPDPFVAGCRSGLCNPASFAAKRPLCQGQCPAGRDRRLDQERSRPPGFVHMACLIGFLYASGLFCAENAVSGVAQAWNDVAVLVETLVNGGGIDGHIRVLGLDPGNALGRADQIETADLTAAMRFQ